MGRMMVGQRKPALTVAIGVKGKPDDAEDQADQGSDESSESDGKDVETCPNCDCQFVDGDDGSKPEIIKPGKPVADRADDASYPDTKGPDLDVAASQPSTPGRLGAAHDAALGDSVMAALLGGVKGPGPSMRLK